MSKLGVSPFWLLSGLSINIFFYYFEIYIFICKAVKQQTMTKKMMNVSEESLVSISTYFQMESTSPSPSSPTWSSWASSRLRPGLHSRRRSWSSN